MSITLNSLFIETMYSSLQYCTIQYMYRVPYLVTAREFTEFRRHGSQIYFFTSEYSVCHTERLKIPLIYAEFRVTFFSKILRNYEANFM
jgi:hypothetical protein